MLVFYDYSFTLTNIAVLVSAMCPSRQALVFVIIFSCPTPVITTPVDETIIKSVCIFIDCIITQFDENEFYIE